MENNKLLKVSPLSEVEMKKIGGGFILQLLIVGLIGWGLFALGNAIGNKFDDCPPCPGVE